MDKQNNEEVQIFARSVATELTTEELETVSGGDCFWQWNPHTNTNDYICDL